MGKLAGFFRKDYNLNIGTLQLSFNAFIFIIVLMSLCLNFYNITNFGAEYYDGGDYLNAAQRVVDGDIKYLGVGIKPLHILGISVGFLIFGAKDYVAFGVTAILGTLTVYMVYLIGRRLLGRAYGLVAALFLALSGYFIYFSKSSYPDITAAFCITLTILLYIHSFKQKPGAKAETDYAFLALSAVFAGICFLTRESGLLVNGVIVLNELVLLLLKRHDSRQFIRRLLVFGIISLAITGIFFAAYNILAPAQSQWQVVDKTVQRVADVLSWKFRGAAVEPDRLFYFKSFFYMTSPAALMLFLAGIAVSLYLIIRKKSCYHTLPLCWAAFYLLFFSFFFQQTFRIFLPAIPAYCLVAAIGFVALFMPARPNTFIKALAIIVLIITAASLAYYAAPAIDKTSKSYKEASAYLLSLKDTTPTKGFIVSNRGFYNFYLKGYLARTPPKNPQAYNELVNFYSIDSYSTFRNLSESGYRFMAIDWHSNFKGNNTYANQFRDFLFKNVQPKKKIPNTLFYTDYLETHNLQFNPHYLDQEIFKTARTGINQKDYKLFMDSIYVYDTRDVLNYIDRRQELRSNPLVSG